MLYSVEIHDVCNFPNKSVVADMEMYAYLFAYSKKGKVMNNRRFSRGHVDKSHGEINRAGIISGFPYGHLPGRAKSLKSGYLLFPSPRRLWFGLSLFVCPFVCCFVESEKLQNPITQNLVCCSGKNAFHFSDDLDLQSSQIDVGPLVEVCAPLSAFLVSVGIHNNVYINLCKSINRFLSTNTTFPVCVYAFIQYTLQNEAF